VTVLKTAIATYPHTRALKDGTVAVEGLHLEHVEVTPIVGAFRRMVRALEFDVSEMAITTYLTARAYDKAFTALPVFVMRQFHHAPIVYNVKSGVVAPRTGKVGESGCAPTLSPPGSGRGASWPPSMASTSTR
jgi:4,5-dihydroxyphthalate decarboxylase